QPRDKTDAFASCRAALKPLGRKACCEARSAWIAQTRGNVGRRAANCSSAEANRRSAQRSAVRLVRGQAAGTATGFPFHGKAVSFGSREDCRIIGRDRSAYFVAAD